jgi:hypothetical protein
LKKSKDVADLAASLTAAATAPLVSVQTPPQAVKRKPVAETLQITLRPARTLMARYVDLAAERSKQLGRTVSAQEIMLEVLERVEA